MRSLVATSLPVLAALLAGCGTPVPSSALIFPCDTPDDCVEGFSCIDGRCVGDETGADLLVDAGATDGGVPGDGGAVDAGAGGVDGGTSDAGPGDAGSDAGPADAGFDAGNEPPIVTPFDLRVYGDRTTWIPQIVADPDGDPVALTLRYQGPGAVSVVDGGIAYTPAGYVADEIFVTADDGREPSAEARIGVEIVGDTCALMLNRSSSTPTAVYPLDPDGPDAGIDPFYAHCEMGAGGGYTLALKADGTQTTFIYQSSLWTDAVLLNEGAPALDDTEAKLRSFLVLPFSSVRALLRPIGDVPVGVVDVEVAAVSLQALFSSPPNTLFEAVGRPAWLEALSGSSLQPNCNAEGVNLGGADYNGLRFGIRANEQDDCGSEDSRIGFGGFANCEACGCGNGGVARPAVGSESAGCDHVDAWGALLVKDDDFTSLPAAADCAAHQAAGRTLSGRYLVDPDGAGGEPASEVSCELQTAAGGWTKIADFDAMRGDPCPGDWRSVTVQERVLCARDDVVGSIRTAAFAAPSAYTEVMGILRAYQRASPDAFSGGDELLTEAYVDGVSFTSGNDHIFTLAGALDGDVGDPSCPCAGGAAPPSFVGSDYACESPNDDGDWEFRWHFEQPLWDGVGGAACEEDLDGSRFIGELPAPRTDPVTVRLMADQAGSDEDVGVYRLELWVR